MSGRAISTESMNPFFSWVDEDEPWIPVQPLAGLPDRPVPPCRRRILYARSAFWDMTFETRSSTTPTASPRLFSTVTMPSSPVAIPSRPKKAASAGRMPRNAPSSTFRAIPRPSGEQAQKRPSAPPFAAQPAKRADEHRVGCDRPAQHLGVGAHRRDRRAARPREAAVARTACAQRSSGSANVGTPQPSIATGIVGRVDLGRGGDLERAAPPAAGASRAGSRGSRSRALGRRRGSRRACRSSCARSARGIRARLEVVLRRRRRREERPNGIELLRGERGATRRRSRSHGRRDRDAPARAEAPGSASPTSGG